MRSVLIYVADEARRHRVPPRTAPRRRVSLFEPINSQYKSLADVDLSDLEPARSRVLQRWQPHGGDSERPADPLTGPAPRRCKTRS
jgi:hypothetical protein